MIERDESPQQAVVREVREEVGLEAEVGPLVAVYTLFPEPVGYRFVFECRIDGEPVVADSGEIGELGWFAPEALPSPTTPSVPPAVEDVLAGRRGVAREIGRR